MIQLLVRHFLISDVGAEHFLVPPDGKYSAEVPPDLPKQQLLAVLRREHDMVLALPCRVVQVILIL